MNFLIQLQNAHVYYFTLRTLKNVLGKAGYDLVRGNEIIYSIFKPSQERDYESDYDDAISFLRKIEYYRFMPVSYYNVKRLAMPVMIRFLKIVGLYNLARKTFYKLKRE